MVELDLPDTVRKNPFYHITVADQRRSRDGRFIEIGYFNPVAKGNAQEYRIEMDRVDYWLSKEASLLIWLKLVSRARKKCRSAIKRRLR